MEIFDKDTSSVMNAFNVGVGVQDDGNGYVFVDIDDCYTVELTLNEAETLGIELYRAAIIADMQYRFINGLQKTGLFEDSEIIQLVNELSPEINPDYKCKPCLKGFDDFPYIEARLRDGILGELNLQFDAEDATEYGHTLICAVEHAILDQAITNSVEGIDLSTIKDLSQFFIDAVTRIKEDLYYKEDIVI